MLFIIRIERTTVLWLFWQMQKSIVVDLEAGIKRRSIAMISIDCVEFPASASVEAGIKSNLKLHPELNPAHFICFFICTHLSRFWRPNQLMFLSSVIGMKTSGALYLKTPQLCTIEKNQHNFVKLSLSHSPTSKVVRLLNCVQKAGISSQFMSN